MRITLNKICVSLFFTSLLAIVASPQIRDTPPSWAYVVNPPDFKAPNDNGTVRHVPGSTAGWTLTQLQDFFFAADWHPEDHPRMPRVVARGRKPDVFACGFCHRADGSGGPENARLTGLPKAYIMQQMADFKNGLRKGSESLRLPTARMAAVAEATTDKEVASVAAYFSNLKPRKTITVMETDLVPKTYVAGWFLAPVNDRDKEPIGNRIVEMPKNVEQFESRDTHSEFIAYAPIGSIARGEALAKTGGAGKTTPCGKCHGPDLRGLGAIPGIAGRSPSYLMRQLYDFQHRTRSGAGSALMTGVVAHLNEEDMVSLSAYAASLNP